MDEIKQMIESSRLLREKLLQDRARPGYHFAIPEDLGLPGDPNGAFYANGRYHLMYLYDCCSDKYRYGHLSSIDLIHWRSHPDILGPDEFDGGIFSGGAFLDDDGTAYITYWGLDKAGQGRGVGGIRIAKSDDIRNNYEKWEKFPGYAIESTEFGITELPDGELVGSADPSNIWKKDGVYYMQTGNLLILNKYRNNPDAPKKYLGDHVDLFKSTDLHKWEFVRRFYDRKEDNSWTDESEDDMCPSFLPLPEGKNSGVMSNKYLQLFIAHNKGAQYYIADYDKSNDKLTLESHGRMSWVDNTYFAPEAVMTPDGRQIMWAWLLDNRENELKYGWSGVYGLPRSLWLNADGSLGMAPIDELKTLRYNHTEALDKISGTSCEIRAAFSESGGFKLRCSPDESEYTLVYYDQKRKELVFNAEKSGNMGRCVIERAPFELKDGEKLEMTVYIDRSVIEVFVNDRQAITRRVYPSNPESTLVKLYGNCPESLDCWEIMPTNMY